MDDFSLRVFYNVAQLKNFSKAADKLYVTQSAISRQIKTIEDKLAVKLFLRKKEGISLTEEGKILFEYTEKILSLYEKAIKEIDHFRHSSLNKMILGASTTLGEYILPIIIGTFNKRHPEADIYLRVANASEILGQMSLGAFNFALVEGQNNNPSFIVEKLFEDELVLIVSSLHPFAKLSEISFKDIRKEPILTRETGSGTRRVMEDAFAKLGIGLSDLRIRMEVDSTEAIKSAVGENLGISFVSRSTLIRKPENITIVPITNINFCFDFNLIYHREKAITSLTLELMECLKERLSNQFSHALIPNGFGSCL